MLKTIASKSSLLASVSGAPSREASPVICTMKLLEGSVLIADFKVAAESVFSSSSLGAGQFPYMYDVVELFLSVDGERLPYFEFELTPLKQTYELKIFEPRIRVEAGLSLGVEYLAMKTAEGWWGSMKVPLDKLGWAGDVSSLVGNAYCILGKGDARRYWSLFELQQERADFHRPEFFQRFF